MPSRPSRSHEPDPDLIADLPAFGPARTMPTNDPLDPATTIVSEEDLTAAIDGDSWDGSDESDLLSSTTTATPSRASTADPAAFSELVAIPLRLAGMGLNAKLAPGTDIWMMDDSSVDGIAGPLGRIAARHAPLSSGKANDVTDGVEAAVAVAGYVVTNLQAQAIARAQAAGAGGWEQQAEQDEASA